MELDLPIVTKLYSVLLWVLPQLSKLPRDHRFLLGDRIAAGLYDQMESLVRTRNRSNEAVPPLVKVPNAPSTTAAL